MKCLEKERGRRYATANGLAADLRRHLNNEPVIARPPSAGYRFYKAWQRNKLAFVAGASVAGALLAGIVATSWQALEANRARIGEKAQRLRADAENADARRLLYRASMNLAQQAWEQNDFGQLQQLLNEAEQSADRGFEWYYWQRQVHLPIKTLRGHLDGVTSAAFSPDGRQILTGSLDNSAKLWDAADGRELLSLTGHTDMIRSVAFSHNGQRTATASVDKTAKVWDAVTGQQVLTFRGHRALITSIAFSPDDLRIVTGSDDQTAKVWEPITGRELATLAGHSVSVVSVAFSPDGRRIITGGTDGLAKLWAVRPDLTRAQVPLELLSLKGHMAGISAVAFSPDGHSIATAGGDQTVKVWEAASPQQVAAWRHEEANDAQYLESLEKQRNGGGR